LLPLYACNGGDRRRLVAALARPTHHSATQLPDEFGLVALLDGALPPLTQRELSARMTYYFRSLPLPYPISIGDVLYK
jgi:hypothetical protein